MSDTVIVEIPKAERRRNALIALVASVGFTSLLLWYAWSENQISYLTWFISPVFILGLIQSYLYLRTTHRKEPTRDAIERKLAEEAEIQAREAEFADRWYVRYALASVCLWVAWHFLTLESPKVWVAVIAAIFAALAAREISLLIILFGIGYLLFVGIAALPISVAVIVGSILIALAIRKRSEA